MKRIKSIIPLIIAAVCIMNNSGVLAVTHAKLNARQRSMIPIAAFTAAGNLAKLESALIKGMEAGLTVNEIKEILIHTYAYAGFPRALNGIGTYMAVLNKRKAGGIEDITGKDAAPLPSYFDRAAYGNKVRNTLVGRDISKRTSGYPVFTPAIDQFLAEHLFADIFYRDILTYQERELVTVSILSSMTGTDPQLKAHLEIAINTGISRSQLEDFTAVLREEVSAGSAERAAGILSSMSGNTPAKMHNAPVKVIKKGKQIKGSEDYFTGQATVESLVSLTEISLTSLSRLLHGEPYSLMFYSLLN
ncbi:MAG: carboxymuconolactone decarboxylase family protein [Spirochaetota bacterium]